ncbi:MAG: hypothetical protein GY732_19790 [Gammaproteobacteria bacterium]|nr:hypothetical protein [Gammaproteobacteria bacterium]
MNSHNLSTHHTGIALLLCLLLLFVMTMLGVTSFSSSHIQERSASNARLQALAIEAAAAGASDSIRFFLDNPEAGDDQLCGGLDHEGWENPTAWIQSGMVGEANLKQRMYCLADVYPCEVDDVDCDVRPPRSQLFVLSRGEILSEGITVATRDVEVRVTLANNEGPAAGCGALCFPACEYDVLEFPSSPHFQIDGGGGPAVTASCQPMVDAIRDEIMDRRIGNYVGGLEARDVASPWDTPASTEDFRINVEDAALAAQAEGGCMTGCYFDEDYRDYGDSVYGTVDNPQITYINGDAAFGGQISGAGILLVTGDLSWNGTPNFRGLMVTLGGTYVIDGGAHGGNHAGAVVILNAPDGGVGDFGPASFFNLGGGYAEYNWDCQTLMDAHELLYSEGQELWDIDCEGGPENLFQADHSELAIISWRENIGWREEAFVSD